jgi:chaperone modulatory protein CbpM
MKNELFIPIREISEVCHIEIAMLRDFADCGLITIQFESETECVRAEEIEQIKRIIDLYRVLGVNKEGIEIIMAMRDQILEMNRKIAVLEQKLEQLGNEHKFRFMDLPSQMGLLIDYDE